MPVQIPRLPGRSEKANSFHHPVLCDWGKHLSLSGPHFSPQPQESSLVQMTHEGHSGCLQTDEQSTEWSGLRRQDHGHHLLIINHVPRPLPHFHLGCSQQQGMVVTMCNVMLLKSKLRPREVKGLAGVTRPVRGSFSAPWGCLGGRCRKASGRRWEEDQQAQKAPASPWRRKRRAWGAISGFVLTQTMTLGESLANYGKLDNNSHNKNIPAQGPTVGEPRGRGRGMVA